MPYADLHRQREAQRLWAARNRNTTNEHKRKVVQRWRLKVLEYLQGHPCVDCGERDPLVLQFDHVRGDKVDAIARLVSQGRRWEAIEAEIAKCEVRCANCHQRVTILRRTPSWSGTMHLS